MKDLRVLVVDDEKDFREAIISRLHKRNIDATGAENGMRALELIDQCLFDIVLLDVRMPEMNGVETLREIKKRKPLMEVIMLTGHASVEAGIEGMKLGAFDYVLKPARFDELLDKVYHAFQKKLSHDEKIRQAGTKI